MPSAEKRFPFVGHRLTSADDPTGSRRSAPEWLPGWESLAYPVVDETDAMLQWLREQAGCLEGLADKPEYIQPKGDLSAVVRDTWRLVSHLSRTRRWQHALKQPTCGYELTPDGLRAAASELLKVRDWIEDRRAAEPPAKPKRRKRASSKPRQLTAKQLEAAQIVGECKGNFAEAARRLGKDRKTVKQSYDAAMKKLGKEAVATHQTRWYPRDRRGQAYLTAEDDRRRN